MRATIIPRCFSLAALGRLDYLWVGEGIKRWSLQSWDSILCPGSTSARVPCQPEALRYQWCPELPNSSDWVSELPAPIPDKLHKPSGWFLAVLNKHCCEFQVFQLTTIIQRGPVEDRPRFELKLDRVTISHLSIDSAICCVQIFARNPLFTQRDFLETTGCRCCWAL